MVEMSEIISARLRLGRHIPAFSWTVFLRDIVHFRTYSTRCLEDLVAVVVLLQQCTSGIISEINTSLLIRKSKVLRNCPRTTLPLLALELLPNRCLRNWWRKSCKSLFAFTCSLVFGASEFNIVLGLSLAFA